MAKILSVSVPDELLDETESTAAAQGRTKSELVREALRSHLKLQRMRALQEIAGSRAERLGVGPEDVEGVIDEVRERSQFLTPRVACDTNVLVSALIAQGPPSRVLEEAIAGRLHLVVPEHALGELERVLREKLDHSAEEASAAGAFMRSLAVETPVTPEAGAGAERGQRRRRDHRCRASAQKPTSS